MEVPTGNAAAQLGNTIVQLLTTENELRLQQAKDSLAGLAALCLNHRDVALGAVGGIGAMLQLIGEVLEDIKIGVTPDDLPE